MFEDFISYLKRMDRSARTIQGYRDDLVLFARWFEHATGSCLNPNNLTALLIIQYRQQLLEVAKAAPATINRRLAAIRAYTTWAVETHQIDVNPTANIKGVEEQDLAPRWLDKKSQAALIKTVDDLVVAAKSLSEKRQAIRDRAIVILAMNTGLRVSELCALECMDFTLSNGKGAIKVRAGKGLKARKLPLNASAIGALIDWLKTRPDTRITSLFIGKGGNGITINGVERRLSELGKQAGIAVTPHQLRHTFCKNLIDTGKVSINEVAALAAHKKVQTTLRYTIPSQEDLENAINALDGKW